MKRNGCKAEITVFLSLLLLILLAFIGSILVACRIQTAKSYKRVAVDVAMNSIFAEYQKELLEAYGIFAIDGSYESGTYDSDHIVERLEFYGVEDITYDIESIQMLTDNGASAYQEQIVYYMEQKYGLDMIVSYLGITDLWVSQEADGISVDNRYEDEVQSLAEEVELAETTLDVEDNPLEYIESLRSTSILNLVVEDVSDISRNAVNLDDMVSQRNLQTGTGTYSYGANSIDANKLLLGEYIMEKFDCAEFKEQHTGLQYELEYILEGKDSDIENLEGVVNQIVMIRTGVNYTCLAGSVTKKAEAEALALTIATAAGVPYLQGVIKESLLLSWAYGESLVEVKSLLQGGTLSLIKTEDQWNLELSNLLTVGTELAESEELEEQEGLSYRDYLRILLYLEDQDSLVMRSLDLVEQSIQLEYGLEYFRVDNCVSKLEVTCTCQLQEGYTYEFPAYYAYR